MQCYHCNITCHTASFGVENLLLSYLPQTPEGHREMICDKTAHTQKNSIFTQPELSSDEGHKDIEHNRCSCPQIWLSLISLQRRDLGKVLWMDNRPGARGAAGSMLLSDQVMAMPRYRAADDKHLLLVPWSLISFQLDSKGPIHFRHLYNVPLLVCRFFLSEPTKSNEHIIIFS